MRRRWRKPDVYDEEGNPGYFLRPVRFPRLHQRIHRLRWSRGFQLHWWLHPVGWVVCGGLVGLVSPWLIPLGIAAFELIILGLGLWSGRKLRSAPPAQPSGPPPDDVTGVREPRRPIAPASAGAVALELEPEPESDQDFLP